MQNVRRCGNINTVCRGKQLEFYLVDTSPRTREIGASNQQQGLQSNSYSTVQARNTIFVLRMSLRQKRRPLCTALETVKILKIL